MKDLAGVCFPISVGCPVDAGPIHMFSRSEELSLNKKGKQTPMKTAQTILYVGLDVHKESIAVAIAAPDGSVRRYGDNDLPTNRDPLAQSFCEGRHCRP